MSNVDKIGVLIGHWEDLYEETGSKGINGWEEFHFNAPVGKHVYYRLQEHGFAVVLPQKWSADDKTSLQERVKELNEAGVDFTVSIHANASNDYTVKGACIFYRAGKEFADLWVENFKEFCPEQGLHGNGKHYSKNGTWNDFYVIDKTLAPTDLIEHGFFTTPSQLENLKSQDFQKRAGEAIVKSACQLFNKEYQPVQDKEEVQFAGTMHIVKAGDTLSKIANMANTTIDTIARLNDIDNPNKIYPGQRLKLTGHQEQPTRDYKSIVPYPGYPLRYTTPLITGINVERVQRAVGVTPDGKFGPKTEAAVKAYQLRHGLTPDKMVGPITWSVMF